MSEQLLSLSNVYLTSLASLFEKTQLMLQQRLILINKISEITNDQQEKKLNLDMYYKNLLEPMIENYKQLEKDIISNQQLYEKIFNTSGAINLQLDNEFKVMRETQEQEIKKQEQKEQELREQQELQDQEKLEREIKEFRENEMREFEKEQEKEQEKLRLVEREKERILEKEQEKKSKDKIKQNVHIKFKNNIKDDIYNSSLLNNIKEEHIEKVIKKQEILERVREKENLDKVKEIRVKEVKVKVKEIKEDKDKVKIKEEIKALRSTHIKILGFDKQNYNLSNIYIEYNYQNYPIVEFFNTCCTFYMGGTCNSPTCSLVHVCIFCLKINYKNSNNLNNSCCSECFPKNLPRCPDKIECVLASRCHRDHHLKEKFSFLLNETRDSSYTKMCYNSHSNKLKCKYAHNARELLCYVCRENHMNSNECVNMPSFKSFANPYLYLCALKRVKTI